MQIILQRCTSKQETMCSIEHSHRFTKLWRLILQPVGFINNEVLPRKLFQCLLFRIANFIGCDTDIPLSRITWIIIFHFSSLWILDPIRRPSTIVSCCSVWEMRLLQFFSLRLVPMKSYWAKWGAPSSNFFHPVGQSWLWYANEMRPLIVEKFVVVCENGYWLKRLSKSHLVRQYTIQTLNGEKSKKVIVRTENVVSRL